MELIICFDCGGYYSFRCDTCNHTGIIKKSAFDNLIQCQELESKAEKKETEMGVTFNAWINAGKAYALSGYSEKALDCLIKHYINYFKFSGEEFEQAHLFWILQLGENKLEYFFDSVMHDYLHKEYNDYFVVSVDKYRYEQDSLTEKEKIYESLISRVWTCFVRSLLKYLNDNAHKIDLIKSGFGEYTLPIRYYLNPELTLKLALTTGWEYDSLANELRNRKEYALAGELYFKSRSISSAIECFERIENYEKIISTIVEFNYKQIPLEKMLEYYEKYTKNILSQEAELESKEKNKILISILFYIAHNKEDIILIIDLLKQLNLSNFTYEAMIESDVKNYKGIKREEYEEIMIRLAEIYSAKKNYELAEKILKEIISEGTRNFKKKSTKKLSQDLTKPGLNLHEIKSPIVGTFYRAPGPDTDPYVQLGDIVTIGSVLCIVEAMCLMNELESDVDGIIVKILVEDGGMVEYNQPLMIIEVIKGDNYD